MIETLKRGKTNEVIYPQTTAEAVLFGNSTASAAFVCSCQIT